MAECASEASASPEDESLGQFQAGKEAEKRVTRQSKQHSALMASLDFAKLHANALRAKERNPESDFDGFVQFSHPKVVVSNKTTGQLTIALQKPVLPSSTTHPGLHKLEAFFGSPMQARLEREKGQERQRSEIARRFYQERGVPDPIADHLISRAQLASKGLVHKWWLAIKKRNFFDCVDEYKYPMSKFLSHEQIAAMRKTLVNSGQSSIETRRDTKDNASYSCNETSKKKKPAGGRPEQPVPSGRPRRAAAKNASIQMELSAMNFDESLHTTASGFATGRNMHELVEPQRFFQERE